MTVLHASTPEDPPAPPDRGEDAPPLELGITFVADTGQVQPVGEVDLATVPLVDDRLELARAAGVGRVVLDLRETTFVDSAALHLALRWQERARREGFAFVVAVGPGAVRRAIDVAGIGPTLTLVSEAP